MGAVGMSWVGLVELMVRARTPEPAVHGTIRSVGSTGEPENATGWVMARPGLPPVFTGVPSPRQPRGAGPTPVLEQVVTVWRDGGRVRVESPAGTPHTITNGRMTWTCPGQDRPALVSEARPVTFRGSGTHLLRRRTAADIAALGEPTGPITAAVCAGRAGWRVVLHAIDGSTAERTIVVDAATGLLLRSHNPVSGALDEWTHLEVGDPLDPALFTYTGPARNAEQAQADAQAEDDAEHDRLAGWFRERVAPTPLHTEVAVELTVQSVRADDEQTGAFEARLDGGRGNRGAHLARRPRTTEPWQLEWIADDRWSTTRWDCALTLDGAHPTPAGMSALQDQLGDLP